MYSFSYHGGFCELPEPDRMRRGTQGVAHFDLGWGCSGDAATVNFSFEVQV